MTTKLTPTDLKIATARMSFDERLRFTGWTVDCKGCWVWGGSLVGRRYGYVSVSGRSWLTHRLAYETWVGPISEGLEVRHKCDNPPCINPDHLELGTHADNMRDMKDRGRHGDNKGTRNGFAKLTVDSVLDIRRKRDRGVEGKGLAKEYHVDPATISKVVRRKTWDHI